jgi:kynureninase
MPPTEHSLIPFDEEARRRDAEDPLRSFRDRFYLPPGGGIYLDGNSLGLLSRDAEASLLRVLNEWRERVIEGWTEADPPWFFLAERLAARAAALVGAEPGAVAVTGSTTVNLHQLLATLFVPALPGRTRILADELNFPSDLYAIESHLCLRGLDPATHLVKVASRDGRTLDEDDIARAFTSDVQIAVLPSVLYTSGQLLDMAFLTRQAQKWGVLIGWDLSHSIGAVPHELDDCGADFAFWCHYKYLNAGPGAVGGLYLNRRHWGRAPGLAGWWGSRKDRQFDMTHTFNPSEGAGALQIGTPHLLSLAPLEGALTLHEEAGMDRLRAKSLALTDFLRRLVEAELSALGFSAATPREDARRGGHLALVHPDAARLSRALRAVGVVPDFRPPDIIRLAPVALYTSFAECVEAIRRLKRLCEAGTDDAAAPSLIP